MTTKTIRSRFSHEVGDRVEGCTILEKRVVIPPDPVEKRRGVYDYVVEVAPEPAKESKATSRRSAATAEASSGGQETRAPEGSFTRASPEEMAGGLIRRIPPR